MQKYWELEKRNRGLSGCVGIKEDWGGFRGIMGREEWGLAEVKWRKIVWVSENFRIFAVAGSGCCLL